MRLGQRKLVGSKFAASWAALEDGSRPEEIVAEVDREPQVLRYGWQRTAQFPPTVSKLRAASDHDFHLMDLQCSDHKGPLSSVPFTCFLTSRLSCIDSSAFQILLLRRLWLLFPPSSRFCHCGCHVDVFGNHIKLRKDSGVGTSRGRVGECSISCVATKRVTTSMPDDWRSLQMDCFCKSLWTQFLS